MLNINKRVSRCDVKQHQLSATLSDAGVKQSETFSVTQKAVSFVILTQKTYQKVCFYPCNGKMMTEWKMLSIHTE